MSDTAVLEPASAPPAPSPSSPPPPTPPAAPSAPAAPSSAVAEPWYKDWIQADGTLNSKALDRLPDHAKGLKPSWERLRSIDDLATTALNQQVLVGKKALAPLPADAPAEAVKARKELLDSIQGVPPSPKDYGIAKPKELPESQWNQPLADNFTAWAHKHSVSPAAAKELIAMQIDGVKGQLQSQAQYEQQFWANEQKTFEVVTKQENIDSTRASALVEKGAIALGLDLTSERTKNFLKGSDARLMALRHALAIGEDHVVNGESKTTETNPGELARSVMHDKSNPLYEQYWNREGKFPSSLVESVRAKVIEWQRLEAAKNPPRGRR